MNKGIETTETRTPPPVYVVTGGLGSSGEQLARTVMAQFEGKSIPLKIVPRVAHIHTLKKVVEEAAQENGTILHTLVDPEMRAAMIRLAADQHACAIDAAGPLIERLAEVLDQPPTGKPGLYRQLHETYFKRIEAIEFTMDHDDGMQSEGWPEAEIVLLGVSRVGKTPISIYLSMMGWKVANIPLVPGIQPHPALFELDRRRVIGLTIDPTQLLYHRRMRQEHMEMGAGGPYSDPKKIYEELQATEQVYQQGGYRTIDVTDKPIESCADEVLSNIRRQLRP
jgi:regulator of PEP synthase PpsR (kinase-PPPase family)